MAESLRACVFAINPAKEGFQVVAAPTANKKEHSSLYPSSEPGERKKDGYNNRRKVVRLVLADNVMDEEVSSGHMIK